MFCMHCGKEIANGGSFCAYCGQPVNNSAPQYNAAQRPAVAVSTKRKGVIPFLVVSAVLLVCVMILPMFDAWGGILSSAEYANFGDVLHYIQKEGLSAFNRWVVLLTMSAFIPAVFSTLAGIIRCKSLGIVSSSIGAVAMLFNYVCIAQQNGIKALTDLESCSISIGSHVALILHIVCFALALNITKVTTYAPAISNSEPAISNSAPVTSSSAPAISNSAPVTSNSAPVISNSEPAVSSSAPAISSSAPVTSNSAPAISSSAPVISSSEPAISSSTPVQQTDPTELKYCLYCGQPLQKDELYCGSCGNPVYDENPTQAQESPTYYTNKLD